LAGCRNIGLSGTGQQAGVVVDVVGGMAGSAVGGGGAGQAVVGARQAARSRVISGVRAAVHANSLVKEAGAWRDRNAGRTNQIIAQNARRAIQDRTTIAGLAWREAALANNRIIVVISRITVAV
jgi:hypothetical protein